jgi:predicted aspartyl protease
MGTFFHPITLVGPSGQRVTIDALVDTGSTFTSIPQHVLRDLGVEARRQVRLRLADGRSHLQDLGHMMVEVDGIEGPTYVVFGENGSPPTIGAVTLEGFLLGVDPVEKRLVSVEGWQAARPAQRSTRPEAAGER